MLQQSLSEHRTRTKFRERSFAIQGPLVWNSLPAELRDPDIAMDSWTRSGID